MFLWHWPSSPRRGPCSRTCSPVRQAGRSAVSKCIEPLTDLGLETLSEVFDSAALANHLRGVSLGQCTEGTVEEVRIVRVLKHHVGQRCTLEIGFLAGKRWGFSSGEGSR